MVGERRDIMLFGLVVAVEEGRMVRRGGWLRSVDSYVDCSD